MYFSAVNPMGKVPPHIKTPFPLSHKLHAEVFQQNWQRRWPQKDAFASGVRWVIQRQSRGTVCWAAHRSDVLALAVVNPCCRVILCRVVWWFLQAYFSWKQEGVGGVKECQQQVTDHDTEQGAPGLRYTGERWSLCLFFAVVIALLYYTTYLAFALVWEQISGRFLQHNSFP